MLSDVTTPTLVVVPENATPDLARTLDLGGYSWKAVGTATDAGEHEPAIGWAGAIVDATADPDTAWNFLRALRKQLDRPVPALLRLTLPHSLRPT